MNTVIDIHTHNISSGENAILNCSIDDFNPVKGQHYCSLGIHPWNLPEEVDWVKFKELAHHPQVLAIGEAGLDKLTDTPMDKQIFFFRKQTEVASDLNLPLIIHSVKTLNEIILLKKNNHSIGKWIIHGFRGKPQMALQLIEYGFYLSYGENFNHESLLNTPIDRLFLETDESALPIAELYERAALVYGIPVGVFTEKVKQNIDRVFFKR